MFKINWVIIAMAILLTATFLGCGGGLNPNEEETIGNDGPAVTTSFTGSSICSACHTAIYNTVINSGHFYKLNKVINDQIPMYPFSDLTGALERITDEDSVTDNSLGTPSSYADISYVIGGYGWKARWIDKDGYIITGSQVQYNLENQTMAAYHDGEADKPYNCGNCHTTGWRHYDATLNNNRQDDLPGMAGTFIEPGIRCESCHGAGLQHVLTGDKSFITRVASARRTSDFLADDLAFDRAVACSECHTRDGEKDYPTYVSAAENAGFSDGGANEGGRIAASNELIRHHEQYDEFLGLNPDNIAAGGTGVHYIQGLTCISCHDPHSTVKYQAISGDSPGIKTDCEVCHTNVTFSPGLHGSPLVAPKGCVDCHMPKMVKSAVTTDGAIGASVFGDIRTHIFKIDLSKDPDTQQFTADGKYAYPWITKKFVCGQCHADPDAKITSLVVNYNGRVH
jgi:formate-dependent nitrite reductase cytochrome c552 subunit